MNCETNNIINPSTSCNKPEGMLKMIGFAMDGVEFATHAASLVKANWDALVQSKDIIPFPAALTPIEPLNEGAIYDQTALGSSFTRDGRMEMKLRIDANLDLHKKLRSVVNSGKYNNCFLIYTSGAIAGTTDGTKIYPFSLEMLHGEFRQENDGATAAKTPIHLTFADPLEYQDRASISVPTWSPFKLKALTNVQLEVVSSIATAVVVKAFVPHINAAFKNPVEGLQAGDFVLTTAAGVEEVIGGVAESTTAPGTYTISGTGFVTGFVNLVSPTTMTTKGYESVGEVAKTVA